jgi:hypothetical protein
LESGECDAYTIAGEPDYTEAKAHHPISLLSFFLEIMEKLVGTHVRVSVLKEYPLK